MKHAFRFEQVGGAGRKEKEGLLPPLFPLLPLPQYPPPINRQEERRRKERLGLSQELQQGASAPSSGSLQELSRADATLPFLPTNHRSPVGEEHDTHGQSCRPQEEEQGIELRNMNDNFGK